VSSHVVGTWDGPATTYGAVALGFAPAPNFPL